MKIRVDKSNPIPIGVQVKEQIKMLIDSGEYKTGDKLPPIIKLAEDLGVNKNTIVTLFKALEGEGYIESFRGKGVFVKHRDTIKEIDSRLLNKVDLLIREAAGMGIGTAQLVNLISARAISPSIHKGIRVLFIMGISQEIVDVNLQKLKQKFSGIEFEGLYLGKEVTRKDISETLVWSDLIIVSTIVYDAVKKYLPRKKAVIKTRPNFKTLSSLSKGVQKKSKIAVIGMNSVTSRLLANMFIKAGLFKPKFVLSMSEVDQYKRELNEVSSIVVCLSAREAVERLNLKDTEIFFFSDYIDDASLYEIGHFLRKVQASSPSAISMGFPE